MMLTLEPIIAEPDAGGIRPSDATQSSDPQDTKFKQSAYRVRKFLMYRPTVSQVLYYIASAQRVR